MSETPDPNQPDPQQPAQPPPPPPPPPPPHGDPLAGGQEAQYPPPPPSGETWDQGYQQPGYQPGYQQPAYQEPAYQAPGYQTPGYQAPGYAAQPYDPAAPYGIHPGTGLPYSDKSKLVAGLLNIFIAGVGRMYMGQVGLGVAQLLVAIFTCGIGAIWSLVDGIIILTNDAPTDAQGRVLKS